MDKIIDKINKSKTIAVLTHISEDADTLGSASAFRQAMQSVGKVSDIYISEKPEDRLALLGDNFIVYDDENPMPEYDLCVCLDCGDLKRLGKRKKIFDTAKHTLNIDHHYTNPNYAEENMVDGDASSTGEVIYSLFIKMDINISKEIAECLYISISSDTGCFKYSNTSSKTMKIVAELLEKGIDNAKICRLLFDTEKREVIALKGHIMENIREYFKGRLCIVSADDETFMKFKVEEKDTGDLVNIPRMVEGCEIAASVRKTKNKVKLSFRSNGKYDVSGIAIDFGGGGHKMAAGAMVKDGDMKQIEETIVNICEKMFRECEDR